MREGFARFNALCFGGMLPEVPLRVSDSRRKAGYLSFKVKNSGRADEVHYDHTLWLSARLDYDVATLEDTLIHEMIHLYIECCGKRDTGMHGPLFRAKMEEINRLHGRHITVRQELTEEEAASDRRRRWHHIVKAVMEDGTECLAVVARTRIFEIEAALRRTPQVREWTWWASTDPAFEGYPHVTSLKLYRVTAPAARALVQAVACECDGRRFAAKRPKN